MKYHVAVPILFPFEVEADSIENALKQAHSLAREMIDELKLGPTLIPPAKPEFLWRAVEVQGPPLRERILALLAARPHFFTEIETALRPPGILNRTPEEFVHESAVREALEGLRAEGLVDHGPYWSLRRQSGGGK